MTADEIIRTLNLAPHPEGGWYRETFHAEAVDGVRADVTAIYYLLKAGERSHWHRVVDAEEIWNWHAGAPLALHRSAEGGGQETVRLGPDVAAGERPQAVVRRGAWQAAEPLGAWSLVGCIVAPAFEFAGFEMAPPGWEPESA